MAKNYTNRNTASTGGKVNSAQSSAKKDCRTCDNSRTIRVSKLRKNVQDGPAKQQYDIVWEKCPDC